MIALLLLIGLINSSISNNTSLNLFQEVDKYLWLDLKKAIYAQQVVHRIHSSFGPWFFTVTFCEFTNFENRILKFAESTDYKYPVLLLNGCPASKKRKVKPKINTMGKTTYVITSRIINVESSDYVIGALVNTGVFKPRSTLVFVLNNYNNKIKVDNYYLYTMKSHFKFLRSKSITTSVVLLQSNNKLKTYTYDHAFDVVKDISDAKNITSLLEQQNENLHGSELRLSVFKKVSEYDDNTPINCESRLAQTVMKRFNATCKPLEPRDGNTVGDVFSNDTATGVTADLLDGYTDLELSSRILKNSFYGYIDTTYPLTQDPLCFVVKSADKQSTFMTIIRSISDEILLLFAVVLVSMILAALLALEVEKRIFNIEHDETRGVIIMDILKSFIRQVVKIKFHGPIFKFLVLLTILYSLIVDCIIDGIITSAITNPQYTGEIDTIEDLLATNLTVAVHNRHNDIFNQSLDNDTRRILASRTEMVNDRYIKNILINRKFQYALLLRKTEALKIIRKQSNYINGRPIYHLVNECPIPASVVYGLRYGSPYKPKLNRMLRELYQAGILDFWLKSEEYKVAYNSLSPGAKTLIKKLDFNNLLELFVLWGHGVYISSFVFLCELLLFWFRKYLYRYIN